MSDLSAVMCKEEIEIIDSQVEEATRMVQATKLYMLNQRPFYGALAGSLSTIENHIWLNTMATDGRRLYFSAEFVMGMKPERREFVIARMDAALAEGVIDQEQYDKHLDYLETWFKPKTLKEICFVLEHELRHIICDHLNRGKSFNHKLYNIASDYYINSALVNEHSMGSNNWFTGINHKFDKKSEFGFILGSCFDPKYFEWHSEDIYEDLIKNGNYQQQSIDQHMNGPGQGGEEEERGSIGEMMGQDKSQQPKISEGEAEENADHVRGLIKNAAIAAGDAAPEDVRELVKSWAEAKINYKQLLRRTLTSLIKTNPSYRRLSRRGFALTKTLREGGQISRNQTIALPSYTKDDTINLYCGFDVSGSITDDILKRIFNEIVGITKQYRQFRITLFCWSTEVGNIQVYTHQNMHEMFNYKITTTGGTHASCVFEKLDEMKAKVDQLLIFTDGYFEDLSGRDDWKKKYGQTLWVIFDGFSSWNQPWGTSVNFDKYI